MKAFPRFTLNRLKHKVAIRDNICQVWSLHCDEPLNCCGNNIGIIVVSVNLQSYFLFSPTVETHNLQSLHTILSTGSPLKPQSYDYVFRCIKNNVLLGSISGDLLMSIFLFCKFWCLNSVLRYQSLMVFWETASVYCFQLQVSAKNADSSNEALAAQTQKAWHSQRTFIFNSVIHIHCIELYIFFTAHTRIQTGAFRLLLCWQNNIILSLSFCKSRNVTFSTV